MKKIDADIAHYNCIAVPSSGLRPLTASSPSSNVSVELLRGHHKLTETTMPGRFAVLNRKAAQRSLSGGQPVWGGSA